MVEKRCPRDRALELVEEGLVSGAHLLLCCLKAMSSADVEWMLDANELSERFLEEEEE
jgi:hypothetical protein